MKRGLEMLSLPPYCSATLELLIATTYKLANFCREREASVPVPHRIIEAMNLAGLTP